MIPPTEQDRYEAALCVWKEARSEGFPGMTAVACVIRNRVIRTGHTYTQVVLQPWQFSSMTAPHDPQLHLLPGGKDPSWQRAQTIVEAVMVGLGDTTEGATLYFDNSISFPKSWDRSKVQPTVTIGRLSFFRELGAHPVFPQES